MPLIRLPFDFPARIALVLIVVSALAQWRPEALRAQSSGTVTGIVTDRDTGQPLPGVRVAIDGTGLSDVTGEDGRYFIIGVQPGVPQLTARTPGYRPATTVQRVQDGGVTTVDFALTGEVVELDGGPARGRAALAEGIVEAGASAAGSPAAVAPAERVASTGPNCPAGSTDPTP